MRFVTKRFAKGFCFAKISKIFGVDKNTITLRIPNYDLIEILLRKTNKPLTGTSANISGKPATAKAEEALKQLTKGEHRPDLFIDAGNLPKNKPSKVIDLTSSKPKTVRY